jgi:hypothetical protein
MNLAELSPDPENRVQQGIVLDSVDLDSVLHRSRSAGTHVYCTSHGAYLSGKSKKLFCVPDPEPQQAPSLELVYPEPLFEASEKFPQILSEDWDGFFLQSRSTSPAEQIILVTFPETEDWDTREKHLHFIDLPSSSVIRTGVSTHLRGAVACTEGLLYDIYDYSTKDQGIFLWDVRDARTSLVADLKPHRSKFDGTGYSLALNPKNSNQIGCAHYTGVSFWDRRNGSQPVAVWNRGYHQYQSQTVVWTEAGVFVTGCDMTPSSGCVHVVDPEGVTEVTRIWFEEFVHSLVVTETGRIVTKQSRASDVALYIRDYA